MRTTITILMLGLGLALAGRFDPAGAGPVAALVPPWQQGGMARAAALGLPVIDIRWNGRLLVLDASAAPGRLAGQGLWLMDAAGAGVCATDPAP
jgi:hypothetical protein